MNSRILILLFIVLSLLGANLLLCHRDIWQQIRQKYPSFKLVSIQQETYFNSPPRWSPDGKNIVVRGIGNVFTIASDGSDKRIVLNGSVDAHAPDWSPDGKKLVYHAPSGRATDLYTSNMDGSNVVRLTNNLKSSNPKWSPDGRKIAFIAVSADPKESNISLMNIDGSNVTQLTHYPLGAWDGFEWSPDSQYISFTAFDYSKLDWGKTETPILTSAPANLYVIKADGSNLQLIADGLHGRNPSWTQDGKTILFTNSGNPSGLYAVGSDGSDLRPVASDFYCDALIFPPFGGRGVRP
jgi:Tol biopolymer transport system component